MFICVLAAFQASQDVKNPRTILVPPKRKKIIRRCRRCIRNILCSLNQQNARYRFKADIQRFLVFLSVLTVFQTSQAFLTDFNAFFGGDKFCDICARHGDNSARNKCSDKQRTFSIIHIAKFPISKVLNHQHDRQCIVHFVVDFDLRNGNFGNVNDRKCALFIRTSIIGRIVSMSQMSLNLSPPGSSGPSQERFANLTVNW